MDKQPKALRLADELVFAGRFAHESEDQAARRRVNRNTEAAAELRRLHTLNQELVEAAQRILSHKRGDGDWLILTTHCVELERVLAKHKEQA